MTSDPSVTLAAFNTAVVRANPASAEINDFLYSFMPKSNWGNLLQPAPMTLLILSELTVVASAADFKLVPPKEGFQHVKFPDSFRATVVQLVDNGVQALEASYANFDDMQQRCAGVKPGVLSILELLNSGNAGDIRRHLPTLVTQLHNVVDRCLSKAVDTDQQFQNLLDLTRELHQSCTATHGDVGQQLSDAKMRKIILQAEQKVAEENRLLAQQQVEDARAFYKDARDLFQKAAQDMPRAWEIIGVQFIESLAHGVLGTLHAGLNLFTETIPSALATQYHAARNADGVSVPHGLPAAAKDSADLAYQKGPLILTHAQALVGLATGGPEGGVNWDRVAGNEDFKGAAYLRILMETSLEGKWGTGEAGAKAQALLERMIKAAKGLEDAAPTRNQDVVANLVRDIQVLDEDAVKFATAAMHKTGAVPMQDPNFSKPSTAPSAACGSAAQTAIRNAQIKLEMTQSQLSASRQASQDASNKLLEVIKDLGKTIGRIEELDMNKFDWEKLRENLDSAIKFLCLLKDHLTKLVRFFTSIKTLVGGTMHEAANHFITLVTDATKPDGNAADTCTVGGITFSQWTCQAIYDQALGAAKVARLVHNIAEIYLIMYRRHIQTGVQKVHLLGQFVTGGTSGVPPELKDAVRDIAGWAEGAIRGMEGIIRDEQAKMDAEMDARLSQLRELGTMLPPASPEAKAAIAAVTQEHVKDVGAAREAAAAYAPTYKASAGASQF